MTINLTSKSVLTHTNRRVPSPTIGEMGLVTLFLIAWLFPVIAAWMVGVSGRKFSYIATHWQNQNLDIVGLCIFVSLCLGIVAAFVTLILLISVDKHRPKFLQKTGDTYEMQRLFLGL